MDKTVSKTVDTSVTCTREGLARSERTHSPPQCPLTEGTECFFVLVGPWTSRRLLHLMYKDIGNLVNCQRCPTV